MQKDDKSTEQSKQDSDSKWLKQYHQSVEGDIKGHDSKKPILKKNAGLSLLKYPIWCAPGKLPLDKKSFNSHYRERDALLRDLVASNFRFISNFWEYFYMNESCLCSLVKDQESTTENKRLKNIKLFGKGKVGSAYLISDTITNKKYILKGINDIPLHDPRAWFYKVSFTDMENPIVSGAVLTNQRGEKGFLTVGLTGFANQTMIHMILNMILGDCMNYVYQYDAFICNSNEGYNIMDIASKSDMSAYIRNTEWTDDDLIKICNDSIEQLLPVLHFLKQDAIGFCHNDLKARNVFVHEEDGKVYYRLADFDKSSITFRGVRFYNYLSEACIKNHVTEFSPIAALKSSVLASVVGFAGATTNISLMFNPYGYYLSHDLYTFIISLAFEPKIHPLLKNPKYKNSLFFKCLDMFGRPNPVKFEDLISKPPANGDSITVINNVMHSKGTNIVTNIDQMMRELKLKPFPVDEAFLKFIQTKDKIVRTGLTGGVCISEDKKATSYFGKPFCDTLPYDNKLGQKVIYDNV